MILLFGGTSETARLADMLAGAGFDVLVSTATAIELDTGSHRRIRRRSGRLDATAMVDLIRAEQISVVVDAAHPYAEQLHATVARACNTAGVRLLCYQRPSVPVPDRGEIQWAADHAAAAALACRPSARVLLTIGSNNLAPYVKAAQTHRAALIVRVLPEPDSLVACRAAGLSMDLVIGARGPFSIEDNRRLLRQHAIDVLVTKESGAAGGFQEKVAAALAQNTRVVILRRPKAIGAQHRSIAEIIAVLTD